MLFPASTQAPAPVPVEMLPFIQAETNPDEIRQILQYLDAKERARLDELIRLRPLAPERDPVHFARYQLGIEPDPWQERVLRWAGRRIALNCSRQSGKSTISAVLALHTALFMPGSLTVLLSPSERQSRELFRKVSDFRSKAPNLGKMVEDNKLSCEFANGSRIVSLPASEGTIRGFSSVDLLIEDEASRVPDALYMAIRPMLAVSGGRLMLMSTPFGKRGHFFEIFHGQVPPEDAGWLPVTITADQCPRITPEFLAEEKRALPRHWYEQEYFCVFADTVDQLFSYEDVMAAFDPTVQPLFEQVDPLSESVVAEDVEAL